MCKNMCLEYSFLGIPPTVADFFFFYLSLWSEKEHMYEVNACSDWGVFTYGVTYMGEHMHEVIGTTGASIHVMAYIYLRTHT